MKTIIIAASLAALTAAAMPASAAPGPDRHGQPMTRTQVQADVRERFTAMDSNKDGAVTRAEFDAFTAKKQAERVEKRGERRDARFAMLDANKDGQVSKAEYDAPRAGRDGMRGDRMGMRGHGGRGKGGWGGARNPQAFFAAMDVNKDGRVTLAEASAKPLAMFDRADTNKDGTVTPEERRAARAAMRAEWQAKKG